MLLTRSLAALSRSGPMSAPRLLNQPIHLSSKLSSSSTSSVTRGVGKLLESARRTFYSRHPHHPSSSSSSSSHTFVRITRHFDFDGNPLKALWAIMGVNAGVFLLWKMAESNYKLEKFMMKHFLVSPRGVVEQHKYHTLLTSFFSHNDGLHFFFNMFTLFFFGSEAALVLGLTRFSMLYFGGGLASSIAYVSWPYIGPNRSSAYRGSNRGKYLSGLGASGAVSSVVAWSILSNPSRMIYMFVFLPVPAALFGLWYIASGTWGLMHGHPEEAAHLGGAGFGAAYFLRLRMGRGGGGGGRF